MGWLGLQAPVRADQRTIDRFHRLYYESEVWKQTRWLGTEIQKCPLDMWIYQEILAACRPDVIVECGTLFGGSALYLASICDLLNHGRIVTIDVNPRPGRPEHLRVTYVTGSSVEPEIVSSIRSGISAGEAVMAILDSDHSRDHVLAELRTYADVVTSGQYMIVEDTNINGHPTYPDFGPGPMEAVTEFLRERRDFVVDEEQEKFFMTFNPKGYLRKS